MTWLGLGLGLGSGLGLGLSLFSFFLVFHVAFLLGIFVSDWLSLFTISCWVGPLRLPPPLLQSCNCGTFL
jgi:hypothetical protein